MTDDQRRRYTAALAANETCHEDAGFGDETECGGFRDIVPHVGICPLNPNDLPLLNLTFRAWQSSRTLCDIDPAKRVAWAVKDMTGEFGHLIRDAEVRIAHAAGLHP